MSTTPPTTTLPTSTARTELSGEGSSGLSSPQLSSQRRRKDAGGGGSRILLVVILIVAMLAAGFVRDGALQYQEYASGPTATRSRSPLGNMNSFALALMLGGLRGPLVMMLWSTSESQKADKDLEDFNTKVEWIRNLQPEFVTVHLFQIWNLAYNVSVQMASLPNRYACIMEALDYAHNVDRGKPDDLNIMHAIAQVYSNKLGTAAQEKTYYRAKVRDDSLPRVVTGPHLGDPGFQRRRMDPILDANFNILPEYLVVRHKAPADLPADAEWNTGEELQFLKPYAPFPYGVSTYALAFNYAKRAEVLLNVWKQQPLQISEMVIDSRPALELQTWAQEEWERGRRFEIEAAGLKVPGERKDMESPTAGVPLNKPLANPGQLKKAIDAYDLVVRLGADSLAEYDRHLQKPAYIADYPQKESQLQSLQGMRQLVAGDAAYLRALAQSDPLGRDKLLKTAAASYKEAIATFEAIVLRHYISDEMAQAVYHASRPAITTEKFTNAQRHTYYREVLRQMADLPPTSDDDDRREYEGYVARAEARMAQIDPKSVEPAEKKTTGGEQSPLQPNPVAPPAPPLLPKP